MADDGPQVRLDWPQERRQGEASIGLRLAGICATDLELIRGYQGFNGVLGHEWVGTVLEAADPQWIGRRVVGDINCPCRRCPTCLANRQTHCPERTVLGIQGRGGAFREGFPLPLNNLHVVPEGVADEAAVFVEPLAAACEILEQVHVRPSDRVVVLGVGRLGQLCARVLALTGAHVTAISPSPGPLALLPSGIDRCLLADCDAVTGADVVVECSGAREGLALATRLVRPRGTVVLKTTIHDPAGISPIPWVIDEVRLIGSRCGPFGPALRMLAAGLVDPTPLITASFPLEQGLEALAAAARPEHMKVVLRADG